ncbi:MAG: helix-turn-helix domain-containing protein [Ilumatobacteraceae bacterium]|jgi:excisionase family DNA binding protein
MRRYLTIDEVAELLGVKPCFVRRLVWERRIPYYKIGKFVRFDPDEIEAWRITWHQPALR